MDNRTKWISNNIRMGWIFLAAGVFAALVGIFIERQYSYLPYNLRIVTGLGILLAGIGIGYLVRYRGALKDELSAKRLNAEERDERAVLLRARAGNRAYWVSAVLVYGGLMWASFAANGGLPELNGDVLWFFLAASVVIPFGVYIVSLLVDQRNS
jgi:hypothetical membrane protein